MTTLLSSETAGPRVGIWCSGLRSGPAADIAAAAAELEELGYRSLWVPDAGGDLYADVERLLDATSTIVVGTGILNIWHRDPREAADWYHRMTERFGPRLVIGLGVSHRETVGATRDYSNPMAAMGSFLDGLDGAPRPLGGSERILAALGPRMLELAAQRSSGVHPYNTTPEHTALARAAVGPSGLVVPEQTMVLSSDPAAARAAGRRFLAIYLGMANYVNNWRRLGFDDADFVDGGSDRLVDAIVPWGDEEVVASHVSAHLDAGASQVLAQVIDTEGAPLPRAQWRALSEVLLAL